MTPIAHRPRSVPHRDILVAVIATFAIHALLLALIGSLAIGAFVTRSASDREVDVVFAEIPQRPPSASLPVAVQAASPEAAQESTQAIAARLAERLAAPPPLPSEAISDQLRDRLAMGPTPTSATSMTDPTGPAATVTFVGVEADRAASVAYVVDASGSLIGTLPIVIDELERSLDRLSPAQRFGVVFFQRNAALVPPGGASLRAADPKSVRETIAWARESVRPAGRSNPLAALETALAWKPDVVFLLSTSITGSGEFELSKAELLERINTVNPPHPESGQRSRLRCIQFLDPDPQETLAEIADRYGGKNGFRYLSREELGLRRSRPRR